MSWFSLSFRIFPELTFVVCSLCFPVVIFIPSGVSGLYPYTGSCKSYCSLSSWRNLWLYTFHSSARVDFGLYPYTGSCKSYFPGFLGRTCGYIPFSPQPELLVFYLIFGSRKSYFPYSPTEFVVCYKPHFRFLVRIRDLFYPHAEFWFSTPYSVDVNPNLWLFPPEYGFCPHTGSRKSYLFSPSSGNLCGSIWLLVDLLLLWLYP